MASGNNINIERRAREYAGQVRGYSDEQIQGFLNKASTLETQRPAFYLALRNERTRRILNRTWTTNPE